ncbi:S24/S26 family peptidase [Methanobrevibacter sp.]|uniref:S24/S26 family peptidase n=1 Tax=Methanobrevibacter sp. TaxID=66852 RepID=UPI00388D071B
MASKGTLAVGIIILILFVAGGYFLFAGDSVTVNIDGENVTSQTIISPFAGVDTNQLNQEICNYTMQTIHSPDGDITSLKQGILRICLAHGLNNVKLTVNTPLGKDKIPLIFHVEGSSMYPTLNDGQTITVLKTKSIQVGNIVVANSTEYGTIVKRVSEINGDRVHLTSDNTNVEYENINGTMHQTKGIDTWVNTNDIYGVVQI